MNRQQTRVGSWRFLLGILLTVLGAYVVFVESDRRYRRDMFSSDDVFALLVLYMEVHQGRFPPSEEALRKSEFVDILPEGGLQVRRPANSQYVSKVYSRPIKDLTIFGIHWGVDIADLSEQVGKVVATQTGDEILLMSSPLGVQSSRSYSVALLQTAKTIKEARGKRSL